MKMTKTIVWHGIESQLNSMPSQMLSHILYTEYGFLKYSITVLEKAAYSVLYVQWGMLEHM